MFTCLLSLLAFWRCSIHTVIQFGSLHTSGKESKVCIFSLLCHPLALLNWSGGEALASVTENVFSLQYLLLVLESSEGRRRSQKCASSSDARNMSFKMCCITLTNGMKVLSSNTNFWTRWFTFSTKMHVIIVVVLVVMKEIEWTTQMEIEEKDPINCLGLGTRKYFC